MIEEHYVRALGILLDQLKGCRADWAVTGSLGMALQGMDLPVHDIDIQTSEDGAYEIERLLAEYVVHPVLYKASERMRSRLGKFSIEGVQVEVIGAIQKRFEDGSWQPPVEVASHRLWIDVQGMSIPVLSLEYEHEAYRLMGRQEKADQIRQWLNRQAPS